MNGDTPNLDVLQNLEASVVRIWRAHPEMTDYVALRAYEAAFQHYRSELRGATPKPSALRGLDGETFEAVKAMCEFRLGRSVGNSDAAKSIPPVALDVIVDCLRKLGKSVEHNTKTGGRKGYLTFIDRFLP
ncbi:MAG TPA: hypothetical protein VJA21_25495 [Verrucomicrobiae bacterium]